MLTQKKILIIEDEESDKEFIVRELKKGDINHVTCIVDQLPDVKKMLTSFKPDIVLSDYNLPSFNGLDAFDLKEKIAPFTPFIFVSGAIGEEKAIEYLKMGITDCVLKDKLFTLNTKINRALSEAADKKEKLHIEKELIKSEERLKRAQNIAKIGSWEADFETDTMFWSDEMYNLYNCSLNTFVPNTDSFMKLVHPDDKDAMDKWMTALTAGKEQKPQDFQFIVDNKKIKHISFQNEVIFDKNTETVKVMGTAQDVTEKKNNMIELQKTVNELNAKFNEQMQFSYIVSHNLRAPIANLIGLTNFMANKMNGTEETHKIVEQIQYTALKMDTIIKDLNLILNERTTLNETKEKITIPDIITSIEDLLSDSIKKAEATIKTNISKDAEDIIIIKSYFESILYNLISNAIKYKSPERELELTISAKKESDNILIKVADNGMGIDLDRHGKHVFGLYKRFHSKIEGKGLGLHMTKTQIETLGGTIEVLSELDKGTTFIITLPKT